MLKINSYTGSARCACQKVRWPFWSNFVDFRALSNQTWSIINIPGMHKGPHSSFNGVILGFSLCDLVDVVVLFCRHTAGFVGRRQKWHFFSMEESKCARPKTVEQETTASSIEIGLVSMETFGAVRQDAGQVNLSKSESEMITYGWAEISIFHPASWDKCSGLAALGVALKYDWVEVKNRNSWVCLRGCVVIFSTNRRFSNSSNMLHIYWYIQVWNIWICHTYLHPKPCKRLLLSLQSCFNCKPLLESRNPCSMLD